jgi:1,4-dihydroxy-2-naphthoyl-CoA hydrolase
VDPDELRSRFGERFNEKTAQAMLANEGTVPLVGIPDYLGMRFTEVGPGWCVCELELRPDLLNPAGVTHGAVVASLIDHTLGTTVISLIPAGSWPATLEFKLNYLAPARDGLLSARGEVRTITTRTAVVAVECDNQDRTIAVALGTIAITPPRTAGVGAASSSP